MQISNYISEEITHYIITVFNSINNSYCIRKATCVKIQSCMLPSILTMFCYRHNLQPYKSHLVTCCGRSMSHCPSCRALLRSLLEYCHQFIVSLLKPRLIIFIYGITSIWRKLHEYYILHLYLKRIRIYYNISRYICLIS